MAGIQVIGIAQQSEWEQCIAKFPRHDVYFTPGYVKAFWENGDGAPLLLYYEGEAMQAMNIVMKRPVPVLQKESAEDEALSKYCDFVTPYGYGGFLLKGDTCQAEKEKLARIYLDFCRDHKVVAEFNRYHPVIDNAHGLECLYQVIDLGKTVCMDLSSKEKIWENLSSKNRNLIRKAQKSNVRIYWGREPGIFAEFEKMYHTTMDKVGADGYYYFSKEFYDSILYDLKENALMFYAKLNEEIIAMSIILFGGGQMHYHLSASRKEFQNLAPTNLLLYEAACFGCAMGLKTFHLGGGLGSRQDHLYHFKKQFNRQEDCQFSIGRLIVDEQIYNRLWTLNFGGKETGFFPAYRAKE